MSWTVTAGKSPVQSPGVVETQTTFVSDSTGKSFDASIRYDGTQANWQAVCAATALKVDAQSKPVFVAPGTVFVIPDPAASVDPTPLPPEFIAWQARFAEFRELAIRLEQGVPIAGLSDRVAQANADQQKAWDASFETFL